MKKRLLQLWNMAIRSPKGWDDYVRFGRWLVYKKLLVLLAILLLVAAAVAVWWFRRPEEVYQIPTFFVTEDRLKAYSGEAILLDGQRHIVYRGQVINGLRSGYGQTFAPSGELLYEGGYQQDLYEGQGRLYQRERLLYEGGFLHGAYSGAGKLFDDAGLLYQGDFLEGLYSGDGVLYQMGKKQYEGGFRIGVFDGEGVLYGDADQITYSGSFRNGLRDGYGIQMKPTGGLLYEGRFRAGKYHGQGILYFEQDGRLSYRGEFVQGKPAKEGSLYNRQGQILYSGPVYNSTVDYLALLGLSLPELQAVVKEIPTIYYDEKWVGYLFRELGFATLARHSFPQPADSVDASTVDNWVWGNDELVMNTLLARGQDLQDQIPRDGVELSQSEVTGFAAFLESRLASVDHPGAYLDLEAKALLRGDHLYEVIGLPEQISMSREGVFWNRITYLWPADSFRKGRIPGVIVCTKSRLGG